MTSVQSLNYHHLRYFWFVAREGGLAQAGRVLRLSHPTLSAQIHALEAQLGEKVFERRGRKLVLTEVGRTVFRYADEIFSLGSELLDTVKGRSTGQPLRLDVGIVDAVPKVVARRLIEPALRLKEPVRIVCYEDSYDRLLADLAAHTLQVVISDAPIAVGSNVRAFSHQLGDTGVSFFATKDLARQYRPDFPRSLDGAPMLLPIEGLGLRRAINQWLAREDVVPRIVGEFEDSAMLKQFGADGFGVFVGPTAVEDEIARQYGAEVIGRADRIRERFYAISLERRLTNPAVVAICDSAREELFAGS
jgi:LysR family transcriptional activator of nhaA